MPQRPLIVTLIKIGRPGQTQCFYMVWRHGKRIDAHCERCPETAATLAKLPLADHFGRAPTAADGEKLRMRVHLLAQAILEAELPGIIELTPGIRSLQIHYDGRVLPRTRLLD